MNPVNCEVCFVHREYFAGTFALGNPDKRAASARVLSRTDRHISARSSRMQRQIDQAERQQLQGLPHSSISHSSFLGRREIV